ncbi:Hypothetical predicted protein [Marmota monax]|uniref:Uncharacterized protein n=1 Tax=Marmota monax TaxID=9995 RepID=A0A5E4CNP4_MARMO|nr:hypothetical protein GHT09_018334 [Marmota monax]KAF7470362.1 hypothetical protein GHT09_018334 [Marmota monax]VTJ82900.1 Hypothetical predicted protein [Marmota monax]
MSPNSMVESNHQLKLWMFHLYSLKLHKPGRAQGEVLSPWREHSHEEAGKCFHIWNLRKVPVYQELETLSVPEVSIDAVQSAAVIWKLEPEEP